MRRVANAQILHNNDNYDTHFSVALAKITDVPVIMIHDELKKISLLKARQNAMVNMESKSVGTTPQEFRAK